MAYVPVPKDFSKIKTKLALNLTKRQIICFSLAGICGDMEYMVWEQNHIRFLWFDTDMSVFLCEIPFLSAVSLRLY